VQARGTRVEVLFQDEARIGQKNSLTRVWGQTGSRPVAPKDLGVALQSPPPARIKKGRDSRIFQAQDRAIDDFTLK
jgi:hypothetical protein